RRSGSRSGRLAITWSTSRRRWTGRSKRCASTGARSPSPGGSGTSRSSCASGTATWARRPDTSTRSRSRGSRSSFQPTVLEVERGGGRPPPRARRLLLREKHVRVVAAARPQEVRHDVAVVAPRDVLMRPVAHVGDVVAHVLEGDDRVELRKGEHAGE